MTRTLKRRVDELEGNGGYYTIGELLDELDGEPLPKGKTYSPGYLDFMAKIRAGQSA